MWEYTTAEVSGSLFYRIADELNALGQDGWEAVGVSPIEWDDQGGEYGARAMVTIGVLLKRQVAGETPQMVSKQ